MATKEHEIQSKSSAELSKREMTESFIEKEQEIYKEKLNGTETVKSPISTNNLERNSDKTAVVKETSESSVAAAETTEPSSGKVEKIPESVPGVEWKVKEIGSVVGEKISQTKSTLQGKTSEIDSVVQDISELISDVQGKVTAASAALQEKMSKSLVPKAKTVCEKSNVEKATDASESETSDVKKEPEASVDKPDASITQLLQKKFSEYVGELGAESYFEAIPLLQEITERKRYVMKIIVIGNSGVGKTSIIQRYVNGLFRDMYKATIGVDYFSKNVETRYASVLLNIYDIAGQDRNTDISRAFSRRSDGLMVCYDVTNDDSFKAVDRWLDSISHICLSDGSPLPRILVGNKCDARLSKSSDSNKKSYAVEKSFGAWLECSAKNGINVESAFETLVHLMIAKEYSLSSLGLETTQNTLKLAARRGRSSCANKCS